jgi:hypothetical protein
MKEFRIKCLQCRKVLKDIRYGDSEYEDGVICDNCDTLNNRTITICNWIKSGMRKNLLKKFPLITNNRIKFNDKTRKS